MTKEQDPILRKIRALLNTAEHPGTPVEEADAAMSMAQRLIAKHAIDQAMLDSHRPAADRGKPGSRRIDLENPYSRTKASLAWSVARNNHCKGVRSKGYGSSPDTFVLIGFEADMEAFEMAYTSLLLQLTNAARTCGFESKDWYKGRSSGEVRSIRQSFMVGWVSEVDMRLAEAQRLATRDATEVHGSSVALVLVDRSTEVANLQKQMFPRLGQASSQKVGNRQGYANGRAAGRNADIGNKRVGNGSSRALAR